MPTIISLNLLCYCDEKGMDRVASDTKKNRVQPVLLD